MSVIPPPPPLPNEERPTEVDVDDSLAGLDLGKPKLFERLKVWGKYVSIVVGILSALGSAWKVVDAIDDLHDTILANAAAVAEMKEENAEEHRVIRQRNEAIITAMRQARAQDQQVITNLRIAVATLQASQGVREGRQGYSPASLAGVTAVDPLDGLALADAGGEGEPEPPRTVRARIRLSQQAQDDAAAALQRAQVAQTTAPDPLAGL